MLTFILISVNVGLNPGSILSYCIACERIEMAILSNCAMHLGSFYLRSINMYLFSEVNEPCALHEKCMFLHTDAQCKMISLGRVHAVLSVKM